MSTYRLSFTIETDADPSALLDRLHCVAERLAGDTGSEYDEDSACVQETTSTQTPTTHP